MKPFRTIAIAALAASVAGTALTAGFSASAQDTAAAGNGGQKNTPAETFRMAQMDDFGGHGWSRGPGHGMGRGGHRAMKMFERFDVNGDGVITSAEIAEIRGKDFTEADADGNGEIGLEEFKAAFMTRSKDRMVRAFQALDRDGDGTVTSAEADRIANRIFAMLDRDGNGTIERVHGPRREHRGPGQERGERGKGRAEEGARGSRHGWGGHGHGRMGGRFLGLFDLDADGAVSREDFDARKAELFALADTDGNGSFTLEDFGPLWLAVSEDRVVRMFQRADEDGSLGISAEESETMSTQMFERADRNDDGVITKADFKRGKHGGRKGGRHGDHRGEHRGEHRGGHHGEKRGDHEGKGGWRQHQRG